MGSGCQAGAGGFKDEFWCKMCVLYLFSANTCGVPKTTSAAVVWYVIYITRRIGAQYLVCTDIVGRMCERTYPGAQNG